jgi:predicted DNA-binding transcriptional regulator AlpA
MPSRPASESNDDDDEYLTPDEFSCQYKIPVSTLYRWRYMGTGPPAIRIGRHLRYRRGAVRKWVRERER